MYFWHCFRDDGFTLTVNQQILAAIKFGVSQNKVIYVNLEAIKFGVSPWPVYAVYDRRICWRRQILAKRRNSPNIIARQNLLIYSMACVRSQRKHKYVLTDTRVITYVISSIMSSRQGGLACACYTVILACRYRNIQTSAFAPHDVN